MIKIFKLAIITAICAINTLANAQKIITEGIVTYGLTYNLPADKQAMAAMLPNEYGMKFKGDLSQFKMDMGMFVTEVIFNNSTKETLSLTDVPFQDKKIAVKMTKSQTEKMAEMQGNNKNFDVTPTTEKKIIATYNCTKYLCKDKETGKVVEVWATTDVQVPANTLTTMFNSIKGVPMEFSTDSQGIKAKITVKAINAQKVEPIKMDIPTGYELMSFDDLIKQMGG
ncbi:MAG: hypothetical protein EAZ51_01915 [Sphingobacteriales bacterium]|nr:MAG: hypothetical protein EAZ64_02580 [Sphingobacteriales bacterium]TAF82686.1 MAG: hypothetical protein EAZ51_01915 [Sphingobacteriales bacterium]